MGRINYGSEIVHNTKGIISPVKIAGKEITGEWDMYQLPMSEMPDLAKLKADAHANVPAEVAKLKGCPVLYEGTFTLDNVGDTFIDMENWGKGIIFVNGVNIGRYWKVGPQQTLYIPGVWLKKGTNKIVIFEQLNEVPQAEVKTVKTPVLMKLNN
jgi:beta-galactosidase